MKIFKMGNCLNHEDRSDESSIYSSTENIKKFKKSKKKSLSSSECSISSIEKNPITATQHKKSNTVKVKKKNHEESKIEKGKKLTCVPSTKFSERT